MNLITRFRRFVSAATSLLMCCIYSQSLYAANIIAKVEKVDDNSIVQTLSVGRDIRTLSGGDTITIPMESPTLFTVSENTRKSDASHLIRATSSSGARLLISADKVASYGSITGGGVNYTISTDNQLGMILVNQNHQDFPEIDLSNDALVPPNKRSDLPGIEQMAPEQKVQLEQLMRRSIDSTSPRNKTNGTSNISMLIIYSREFGEGFASPTVRINDLLSFTNQSLSDSNIRINFTLARAQQLNFNNSLSTGSVLQQVTNGTGAFSGVAALRNQVGADMVAVLSFSPGSSANGVAWVNGDNPNFAFSATRLSPGCCNSVFAHELGHNMGSGHERASVNSSASDPCSNFNFTGFSCGHGNASRNWGTIMSRLNRRNAGNVFSNPLSSNCRGEPCGIPQGQAGAADNTRSFNIARLLVANFRVDPNTPSGDTGALPSIYSLLLDQN